MIKNDLKNDNTLDQHLSAIVDTRFQSFVRVYIHDILTSESIQLSNNQECFGLSTAQNRKGLVKINEIYLQKVGYII